MDNQFPEPQTIIETRDYSHNYQQNYNNYNNHNNDQNYFTNKGHTWQPKNKQNIDDQDQYQDPGYNNNNNNEQSYFQDERQNYGQHRQYEHQQSYHEQHSKQPQRPKPKMKRKEVPQARVKC